MAASIARIASVQTTSSRLNPASRVLSGLSRRGDDVGSHTTAPFLPVRAIGNDVVAALRSGCAIDIGTTPRVIGHSRAPQIRSIPPGTAGALHQRAQAFRIRGKLPSVQKIQIK